MARTPYEIRLDILCLARDILADKAQAEREADQSKKPKARVVTTEDVLAEAEKLSHFVNGGTVQKAPASQLPTG